MDGHGPGVQWDEGVGRQRAACVRACVRLCVVGACVSCQPVRECMPEPRTVSCITQVINAALCDVKMQTLRWSMSLADSAFLCPLVVVVVAATSSSETTRSARANEPGCKMTRHAPPVARDELVCQGNGLSVGANTWRET